MTSIAILGTGDVAKAAAVKISQVRPDVEIRLIGRNMDRLLHIQSLCNKNTTVIRIDATLEKENLSNYLYRNQIKLLMNLASPYVNMDVMECCLVARTNYLDTACWEEKNTKGFSYKEQLALTYIFKEEGLIAILGAGGSPGITNLMSAKLNEEFKGDLRLLEIMDGNAGGQSKHRFATNFSPEDNIKELDNQAKWYHRGQWYEEPPFSTSIENKEHKLTYYRIFHEELETLVANFPKLIHASNYMSFGPDYINCFKVLRDVGMFDIKQLDLGNGTLISPIQFLSKVLPLPSSLASITTGKAYMRIYGQDQTELDKAYEWEMDHQICYQDTNTGAVAWSTGVPAAMFAEVLPTLEPGIYTPEQLPTDTCMNLFPKYNLDIRKLF